MEYPDGSTNRHVRRVVAGEPYMQRVAWEIVVAWYEGDEAYAAQLIEEIDYDAEEGFIRWFLSGAQYAWLQRIKSGLPVG